MYIFMKLLVIPYKANDFTENFTNGELFSKCSSTLVFENILNFPLSETKLSDTPAKPTFLSQKFTLKCH